jgi:translation initiation factor IF-3
VVLLFRGREREHPERGRELLLRLASDLAEVGRAESAPLADGRTMTLVIVPHRSQRDPTAEETA